MSKAKPAGRKPKAEKDKVKSKGVYLTQSEWKKVERHYGSGTKAIRDIILPLIEEAKNVSIS